jgi:hypothetical protein
LALGKARNSSCSKFPERALGKENTKKNKKLFAGCLGSVTPGKEIIKKI